MMGRKKRTIRDEYRKNLPQQVVEAYHSDHIDVKGSYTGKNLVNPYSKPEQDADDL